jgi:predicted nucleic acid-binding protein
MRIIVSDSSCLIDLRKASLLDAFLKLTYEIVIPDTLFEEELLKFSAAEKAALLENGLKVVELPGEGVRRAQQIEAGFPALSIHDCFAFALAERTPNSILLTGDGKLRDIADNYHIEVHGVLWAIDEIHKETTATVLQILNALELFESNPAIFRLPARELRVFIKRYKSFDSGVNF